MISFIPLTTLIQATAKSKTVGSTTSTLGLIVTTVACSKNVLKAVVTPSPWCKTLYVAAAGFNGISTIAHGVSAFYKVSSLTSPTAMGTYGIGSICALVGNACQRAADSTDPTSTLTESCLEEVLKKVV